MRSIARSLALGVALSAAASWQQVHGGGESGAGTFAADLPSASGCGRRILLELFTDASYVFVQRYLCRPWSSAQMESGSWSREGGAVVLRSARGEMRFLVEDPGLRYEGDRFGQSGLRLELLD